MTHEDRVWHHEMETCEGIHEHAERIASLEELVADMWREGAFEPGACYEKAAERLEERTRELGIEVDG